VLLQVLVELHQESGRLQNLALRALHVKRPKRFEKLVVVLADSLRVLGDVKVIDELLNEENQRTLGEVTGLELSADAHD